jgi:hypothetical protein
MSVIGKTLALLDALTPADVQALSPFERRRFADLCKHLADLAERPDPPKAGFIEQLARGERAH